MAEAYDRWLVPTVFRPFADDLAARVVAFDPARILEVAAGSGAVTSAMVALAPSAEIVATDLSPAMVEFGAAAVPQALWRRADALSLPFVDGEFDVVVCQFGVMFFPDRVAALREMGRVTTPDGRMIYSVWETADRHDFARALQAGLQRAFPDDLPKFVAAIPHGYSDVAVIAADVVAAGLDIVAFDTIDLVGHAASAEDIALGFCLGTPVRGEIESRGSLADTIDIVADEIRSQLGTEAISGRMTAHVIEVRSAH